METNPWSKNKNMAKIVFCFQLLLIQLSVSPCVRSLTTPTFLDRFLQLWYQWKPHAKRKVLRPFGNKSMVKKQKYDKNSFFPNSFLFSCLSVCPFVCPCVCPCVRLLTTPTFLDRFAQKWYLFMLPA